MKPTKIINNKSKRIGNRAINYVTIVNSINYSFKISNIYLPYNIFSEGFTETKTKDEYKTGKVWLLQMKRISMVTLTRS